MKRFLLALAILLVFSSGAHAEWFDTDWEFKRPIQLPGQDLNKYTVIRVDVNFADLEVIADMNDLIVVDENTGIEVWRLFDGNFETEDGNLYFPLNNQFSEGDPDFNSTYFIYYGNSSPPNKDFNILATRATTANFETNTFEGWVLLNDFGEIDSTSKLDGTYSMNTDDDGLTGNFFRSGIPSLNDSNNDVNYSTLFKTEDTTVETYGYRLFNRATGKTPCVINIKTGTFFYNDGIGVVDSTVAAANDTTYKLEINYVDGGRCYHTVYEADGTPIMLSNGAPEDASAEPDEINIFTTATGTDAFWDVLTYAPATTGIGLGDANQLTTVVNIISVGGFLDTGEYPTFFFAVDGNLTIDFSILNVDNNRLLVDINYSTSSTIGTGTPIVEDLNLTTGTCNTVNWDGVPAICSWDWNISGVVDLNYFILVDVNAGNDPIGGFYRESDATSKTLSIGTPKAHLTFKDENSYVPLTGLSIILEGTTYTTNSNGVVDINLDTVDQGVHTLRVFEDSNYGSRFFEIDVNSVSIDQNFYMLRDINGIDFNMLFYDIDQSTILANTRVYVYKGDHNVAEVITTDALGQVDFFLNPDTNYYFKPGDRRYDKVRVTFKLPLDEAALTTVTPYNLSVSNLISKRFTTQSGELEFHLFANTVENYKFDLNAGSDYYERKLLVNYRGNPQTSEIQMYLVKIIDSVSSIFFTKDATDLRTRPNIRIEVFKTIFGVGTVEVQSVITDGAGSATLSFIIDDEYRLDFYDEFDAFVFSTTLRPNFTTYFVYLDLGEITWTEEITQAFITIKVSQETGFFVFDETGFDFNVTVDVNGGSILRSWLTVANEDGNISFNMNCSSSCGYHLLETDLNGTQQITLIVFVEMDTGLVQKKRYSFVPVHKNAFNMVLTLRSGEFREQFGCSADPNEPCFFLLMVAAFLTIAGLIGIGAGVTTDTSALGIVAMGFLGLFTYLTWIPVGFFILACLAAFASIILSRRGF